VIWVAFCIRKFSYRSRYSMLGQIQTPRKKEKERKRNGFVLTQSNDLWAEFEMAEFELPRKTGLSVTHLWHFWMQRISIFNKQNVMHSRTFLIDDGIHATVWNGVMYLKTQWWPMYAGCLSFTMHPLVLHLIENPDILFFKYSYGKPKEVFEQTFPLSVIPCLPALQRWHADSA
jgi:hypothetical protein